MWTYIQSTGALLDPSGVQLTRGYSGFDDATCKGLDNPEAQGVPSHGPIPCGHYTVGPVIANGGHLGINVMHLEPDASTAAFIRSLWRDPESFFCHGGLRNETPIFGTASRGCIVLPEAPRGVLGASGDRLLAVRAS
jgi:hypothetical protein